MKKPIKPIVLLGITLTIMISIYAGLYIFNHSNSHQVQEQTENITIVEKYNYSNHIVEYSQENAGYPEASEFAAAVIILRTYGYADVEIQNFIDNGCIPFSNTDAVRGYYGNIDLTGYGYEEAIALTINYYFRSIVAEDYIAIATTMQTKDLEQYINTGQPVLVWFTNDYEIPEWYSENPLPDNKYNTYYNKHCVVVYQIDNNTVYFSDPLNGLQQMNKNEFTIIYEAIGCHAIIIAEK